MEIGSTACVERERLGVACADVEPEPIERSPDWDVVVLGATGIAPLAGSETDWFDELLDITRAPAVPTDSAAATATNAAIRPSRLGPPWRAAARPSCGRGEATEALAAAGAADLALACGPVVDRAARISAMFSGMVRSRGPSVAAFSSSARRYAEAWPGRDPGPASVGSEV
jgi:hypothetical protein